MIGRQLGKEPETYYSYQLSYDLAVAARLVLITNGFKIVDLFKYSIIYWVVEYKRVKKTC